MDIGKTLDWNGIFAAIIPLYAAIGLAFASVRWWKLFTPEQCIGINRYVVEFAIPFLMFDLFISTNMYNMSLHIFAADALQKSSILVVLFLLYWLRKDFTLEWVVTLFGIISFSNNILMGIPLIGSMYGQGATTYLIQILIFNSATWLNFMIAMYEFISKRRNTVKNILPETDNSIKIEHGISLSAIKPSSGDVVDSGSKNLKQPSSNNTMAHESYHVDVQNGPSEPSLQQEVTSNSPSKSLDQGDGEVKKKVPKCVLLWRKMPINNTSYATVIGIVWSLIIFRFHLTTPWVIKAIVAFISKTGITMAMFSLGFSIALQPSLMASKLSVTVIITILRLVVGPAIMAAASAIVGLKGVIFQIAIIQAALPTLVTCFAFAKQYNVFPEILSTSIVISTCVYLPFVLLYAILLQHYT